MPKEEKAKVIKLSDWHRKKECNCILCVSKCPECGSTDIEVKFKAAYEYENNIMLKSSHIKNAIFIRRAVDVIKLNCNQCNARFEDSGFESDWRLVLLGLSIKRILDLPVTAIVEHGADGELSVRVSKLNEQD